MENDGNYFFDRNETSSEMYGEKGMPVMSCNIEDRRPREWENKSHKSFIKPVGGGSTFTFGEFMTGEEAQALIKRRPGSECKMREMSGNHIFEKDRGAGSVISGCYPPRPTSSSKASELQGHNIFEAFSNPYYPPPPPPMCPYEPHEVPLPPNKLHRNPGKLSSQFRLGGPVCIDRTTPKTESAWAKQKMLYGSMEEDSDSCPKPVVSAMKARELAGHTNLFGIPPSDSPPCTFIPEHCEMEFCGAENDPADSASQVHRIKMRNLNGHNAVFINNDSSCSQESKRLPLSYAKAQEWKWNDIFASVNPDTDRGCSRCRDCDETRGKSRIFLIGHCFHIINCTHANVSYAPINESPSASKC